MAEDLEAGNAYLQLMASAAGLQGDVNKKVRKVNAPDIIAKIDGEIAGLEEKAGKAREILARIKASPADPQIGLDITALEAKAQAVQEKLDRLRTLDPSIKVNAQIAEAEAQLGRIETKVEALKTKAATVRVEGNVSEAERDLNAIEGKLTALRGQRAQVQLDAAGAAGTIAALDSVESKRRRVDGSNATVSVAAAGGAQASGILGAIVAGLAAVSAAAPAAVGGLAAVLSTGSAAAQAGGAVKAGFSGISDAIKAVDADEKSAATTSSNSASSQTSSANQVASARSALSAAISQADRTAITGADSVADAVRAEARAQVQADRTRITSAAQVASARRALDDAIVSGTERVEAAERSEARSEESARYAQEALTRARHDAVEANEDLQLSLSGTAIAERRAVLAQKKARAALAGSSATGDDREELQLDVDEADQNLAEIQSRYSRLSEQQDQFARTGVEGTDQVTAATRSLREAQLSEQDAARGVASAQRESSRQIQEASLASAAAVQQAGWSVTDSQDAVADAARAEGRAVRDAGFAQQDAARGVADAQRGLQQALDASATSAGKAGAAGKQSAYELGKLTPAGREYVRFWTQEWKPGIQGVVDQSAGELLPRLETAQRNLLGLQPLFARGLSGSAGVIGDLAVAGSNLATSPAFQSSFATIMDSNQRTLHSYGEAGLYGVDSMRALTLAGLPLSERLARTAEAAMRGVDSFLLEKEASGELAQFMGLAGDKLFQVLGVAGDLASAALQLAIALRPVGDVVLDVVGGTAQLVGEFAQANPGFIQFAAVAGIGLASINALAKGVVALQASMALTKGGVTTLAGAASSLLNPAALNSTQGMIRFGAGAMAAGEKAGLSAGKASLLARGLTGAASAAPLVGLAVAAAAVTIDAFSMSTDEATAALARGGSAAQATRAELADNDHMFDSATNGWDRMGQSVERWINRQLGINPTTKEANAALEEQRAQMSNLERAQSYATQAQGDYELAVRQFGAASPQAVEALGNLNARTRDVEIAQVAVREKTDLATAAVLYQRDQLLAGLDANLRARLAAQQLARDQDNLAKAIKDHGAASQEAKDAGLQLEQSQLREAEAAKSSAGGQQAYVQSIKDMEKASRGQLTPTLIGLIGTLDWAGLSAAGAKVHIDDAGRAVATFPDGKTVVLDANTSPAVAQINFTRDLVNSTHGTIGVDADTGPGEQKVGGFKLQTDATTGVVTINGNITPADQQRLGIQAKTDGTTGTMWIDGNPVPCDGQLNGMHVRVDHTTGVMTIDGDPHRADAASRGAHDRAGTPASFPIDVDTRPARSSWQQFWDWVEHFFGGSGVKTTPVGSGGTGGASGHPFAARADGGLVTLDAIRGGYAGGGPIRWEHYPTGGAISGPGTGTSDDVPIMASNGEYVVRAAAVSRVGIPALDAINALRDGGPVSPLHRAGGGAVVDPGAASPAGTSSDQSAAVPTGGADALGSAAAAGAASTGALAGAMGAALGLATQLDPALAALAATQVGVLAPSQAAVAAGQQAITDSAVTSLLPTMALYGQAVGVDVPLANTMLQGAQLATRLSTDQTALNTAINCGAMAATTTGMSQAVQAQHAGLRAGHFLTQQSANITAANAAANNANMIATTGSMSAITQGHLAGLRGAQAVTSGATTAFADAFRAQMGRTQPDSANPIRWVINFPIHSLTDAWNSLDAQFALGKHVAPPVAAFATGGPISGAGTGTSDDVPIMASDGEFVVREAVASRTMPFLEAFNAGQPEAIHAAGGFGASPRGLAGRFARGGRVGDKRGQVAGARGSVPGFAAGGPIEARIAAAHTFARSMNGKPYIWGGTGPAGMDCSGLVGAVTHVLRGESPFAGRLGVAAGQPWPGFRSGLGGQWATGFNATHTAGTLTGVNIESSKTPIIYPGAHGADSAQFTGHAYLPEIGGQFMPGGAGGGIDITPIVDAAFAKPYREIGDVPKFWGPSAQVGRDQGVARQAADRVKAVAMTKLSEMFAAAGNGAPGVGPVADQVRAVANGFGWGAGPEWAALDWLISHESGWNPRAKNPSSTAFGLFQFLDSTWGTLGGTKTDNPTQQARLGLKYIQQRYRDPLGAKNFWVGHHWYDQGGLLPTGATLAMNGTGEPEKILDPVESGAYDTLSQLVGRSGLRIDPADLRGTPSEQPPIVVHVHPRAEHSEANIADAVVRRLDFAGRG